MSDFDAFAFGLLEQAKRFLEKAKDESDQDGQAAYLHAAVMLSFAAIEAHVNGIGEEMSTRKQVSLHDKGILLEQEVRLKNGHFELASTLKMVRLEDRLLFMIQLFSGKDLDRQQSQWWSRFSTAVALRNGITHPRALVTVTLENATAAVGAVVEAIDALYMAAYRKRYPAARRRLGSKLNF